jgi:hypothetical protein
VRNRISKICATLQEIDDDPQIIDFMLFVNDDRLLICIAVAISLVSALNFGAESGET